MEEVSMTIRIGINGFGRIGRTVLRAAFDAYPDCEIVHINDLIPTETNAHLLKYDSVHGRFAHGVEATPEALLINGKTVTVSACKDPAEIPWATKKVDIVFECTGIFTARAEAMRHQKAGASRVLISAPATGEDLTVVCGVNSEKLQVSHQIVSNGSCTTNCLAPVAKLIHDHFRIESGLMTTIHSYTNDQKVLDIAHKDLRRSRAAALSMIPTSTGAAKALGLVLPELKGKVDGLAVRVPTSNVSLVDVTFRVEKATTTEEVNRVLQTASQGAMRGILGFTMEPLVSIDFNGDTHSSFVDGSLTKVLDGHLVKILSWYDNETGFSYRMLDVARLWCQK
jgi:glyceraldehyde 3-phosphate dehydrogenase